VVRPGLARAFFFFAAALCLTPWVSPPIALALGLVFGAFVPHPFARQTRRASRWLLQASVVALGFGMDVGNLLRTGERGVAYTAVGITFALAVGMGLGALFRVRRVPSFLIAAGTAICGGSAIAAVGPLTRATDDEMSVSLGTIFILNSVALFAFPAIGAALHLSQQEFGAWAALAIHDTSSVVGAGAKFGSEALALATTLKLTRALWIVPLSLGVAALGRARAKIQWPWFIGLFALAAALHSAVPVGAPAFSAIASAGRVGLTLTLFLIGTGLSPSKLKEVGPRPLILGTTLWLLIAAVSLLAIRSAWIVA
jgi:uncharacterized integral membrane protein (TIGR00698 family)